MTNEINQNEASEARAVSSEVDGVGTTMEGGAVSNERDGAASTVATIRDAVTGVEIIDFDAFVDNDSAAGATVDFTKEQAVVKVESWWDGGGDRKQKSNEKAPVSVLTAMMAQPLLEECDLCRAVTEVVVTLASPSGLEGTAAMRQERKVNRANTEVRDIPGVETLPGQAQLHDFVRGKTVAENWLGAPFSVAQYLAMRDEHYGAAFLDAQGLGAKPLHRMPGDNSKQRTREVTWVHQWWHCGGRVEGLEGSEGVDDMHWIRNRDEILYWCRL